MSACHIVILVDILELALPGVGCPSFLSLTACQTWSTQKNILV